MSTSRGMSMEERNKILVRTLQGEIVHGGRIETQDQTMAVLVYGRRVNHLLHFFIGLFTFGLWWFVWILLAITGGEKRRMITVDENGSVRST